MESSVRFEPQDSVLLIRLNSPDQFPRLTRAVLRELLARFEILAAGPAVHAVVLTGTPKSFAAGADLEEVSALTPVDALRFSALGQSLMRGIESCPKPVVAAVGGYCLGGGFDLAMACHLRIAADDARFGHPGGSLGIITGWGGTARLPRIVGAARARELLTTGRIITAEEAYAWCLVSRVVPPADLLFSALEIAHNAGRRVAP
ncbi:MAG TPA: enoyl-CoA hydratase/isomerase family protein [Candidatus Acidoferrales bacterium]|nr:enoyl-CoA hydratase/isomerase family protein [Candidatus Acidoferrales bacterium]